jgi:hypothetical protein
VAEAALPAADTDRWAPWAAARRVYHSAGGRLGHSHIAAGRLAQSRVAAGGGLLWSSHRGCRAVAPACHPRSGGDAAAGGCCAKPLPAPDAYFNWINGELFCTRLLTRVPQMYQATVCDELQKRINKNRRLKLMWFYGQMNICALFVYALCMVFLRADKRRRN